MAEKFKRRQYYINRKFQTVFILKFIGILLLGAVLSVLITMFTTKATLTTVFDGSQLVIEKTSLAILPSVIYTNIITTVIIALIAGVITLLVSHKIAGPMFRFEKDLEEIAQGDLQKKIRIRKGDQFESVAVNLNEMVGSLNSRLSNVHEELSKLSEMAEQHDLPQTFVEGLDGCRRNIETQFKL